MFELYNRRKKLPFCEHYAGNERFFNKALEIYQNNDAVFDITLDLEDGAVIGQEQELRQCFSDILAHKNKVQNKNHYPRIGLRIHEINHKVTWQEDLFNVLGKQQISSYIMIPKVNTLDEIKQVVAYLHQIAIEKQQEALANIALHVLIETPQALQNIHEIVNHKNVESLSFGIMDYVSHLDGAIPASGMHSPQQFSNPLILNAKLLIAQACAWAGKVANHNVCVNLEPGEISGHAFSDAKNAINLGFQRMWSVHPEQILPIVRAFTPTMQEKEKASEILSLAKASEWGPIRYENQLHDRASYRYYYQLLQDFS